jgi:hypothetical protein
MTDRVTTIPMTPDPVKMLMYGDLRLSWLSISGRPVRQGLERSNRRRDEHGIHDHCEGEPGLGSLKLPSRELLAAKGQDNEGLVKAGVRLSGGGLQPRGANYE